MLQLILLQGAGLRISNELPAVGIYIIPRVYYVPTCAKFDMRMIFRERNYCVSLGMSVQGKEILKGYYKRNDCDIFAGEQRKGTTKIRILLNFTMEYYQHHRYYYYYYYYCF